MSDLLNRGSCAPVFICGYPKSGTTLLLSLLDRHPELLVYPEEGKLFMLIVGHPERRNLNYVLSHTAVKAFSYDEVEWPSGYRNYSSINFAEYKKAIQRRWGESDGSDPSLLESIVFSYGEVTGQSGKKCWVEKTPNTELHLELALAWWPGLQAIYIVRDPRDNYCSYRKQKKNRSVKLSTEEFATAWLDSLNAWEHFATTHNPNSLLIRYDDLVREPRATMQRVCDFLQIGWDDVLLCPTRNGVSWSGNSMYSVKFEGISTASVGKYSSLLTADESRDLETRLGRQMVRYGWQLEQINVTRALIHGVLAKPLRPLKSPVKKVRRLLHRLH